MVLENTERRTKYKSSISELAVVLELIRGLSRCPVAEMATLVTSEKGNKRNSIPFIAKLVGVKCMDILGFFDEIQPKNL